MGASPALARMLPELRRKCQCVVLRNFGCGPAMSVLVACPPHKGTNGTPEAQKRSEYSCGADQRSPSATQCWDRSVSTTSPRSLSGVLRSNTSWQRSPNVEKRWTHYTSSLSMAAGGGSYWGNSNARRESKFRNSTHGQFFADYDIACYLACVSQNRRSTSDDQAIVAVAPSRARFALRPQ
jgi:hypothetical protein